MSIDWITVAAQLVNFLVLIWLLKRFLYRPILDGIDAREAEINARAEAAEEAKTKAIAAETDYREKLAAFEAERTSLFEAAQKSARDERSAQQVTTNNLLESEMQNWNIQKAKIRSAYAEELRNAGAGALLSLSRKALTDLSDTRLEDRIVDRLASQLAEMGEDLRAAARNAKKAVAVTSFPLGKASRTRLARCFKEIVPDIALTFETDKTQSPGIKLRLGNTHVGWTVDSYFDELQAALEQHLGTRSGTRAGAL